MLSDRERRELLEEVVEPFIGEALEAEWLTSERWSGHVRLQGATGNVGHVLTSPEWQEARFESPHRSAFLITDSNDEDDVRKALERLTRVVIAYVCGANEIERRRGFLRTQTTLVVHTEDGIWRIGKRSTQPPKFSI